ncbi:MAG TPA: class I SAM-dependent methyltransferase [Candidatus Dormibacteraeota bacterium]|nr:class I SAM-dependent methyltransferase [Candidatus Dormibacteraeota bacterium]
MRRDRRQTPETIRADFDRIALLPDGGWDHNRHYQRRLLRAVPHGCGRALDVGCGTGLLTRTLAARCEHVTGIDLSPNMVEEARRRSADVANVEYVLGDVMAAPLDAGGFECVASSAVLHHLPLAPVLERLRDLLRPGGVLLVLDLRESGPLVADLAALAVSIPLTAWHNHRLRQPAVEREAWDAHGRTDRYPAMAEVREAAARVLPGALVRRHLLWRYSLAWRKP